MFDVSNWYKKTYKSEQNNTEEQSYGTPPTTEERRRRGKHFSDILALAGEKYLLASSEGINEDQHKNLVAWSFEEAAKELRK